MALGPSESFKILPPVTAGIKRIIILELTVEFISCFENTDCCRSYSVIANIKTVRCKKVL